MREFFLFIAPGVAVALLMAAFTICVRLLSEAAVMAYNNRPPFVRGSKTSKAAADSVMELSKTQKAHVLSLIKDAGIRGMTCDEVELVTGGRHQAISARIRELSLSGRIMDIGHTRKTSSGRQAVIYRFVE